MGGSVIDILVLTDTHYEYLRPFSPRKTINMILSETDADLFVNLGDNSGKYALRIKDLAMDNSFPYLSVLGNHDVEGLSLDLITSRVNSFLSKEMSTQDRRIARKYGYGVFNTENTIFRPVVIDEKPSDLRMYISCVETSEGRVGIIYRHFPFFFNRGKENEMAIKTIHDYGLESLYILSGHLHKSSLQIEGQQKNISIENKQIPIFNVILPPFTRSEEEFYAGLYLVSILDDGSLKLVERYYKGTSVRNHSFGDVVTPGSLEQEIVKGELLVRA